MTRTPWKRLLALLMVLGLVAAACGGGDDDEDAGGSTDTTGAGGGTPDPAPGFDGTTIKLGMITPLTGPVAVIGTPLTAGHQVWWDYVNDELGGVGGKYKVEHVTEDSQYQAPLGLQAYNKIKNDVVMISQLLGTPITKAALPQLRTDNMVAAPASLDADWVRDPNLLAVGGPYQVQMANAVTYFVEQMDGADKVLCSMHADDPYGVAGQEGIDAAVEELEIELASTAKFKTGDQDFTAQIGQLKRANCAAVFLVNVVSDTAKIMGTAAQLQFTPQWFGQSPSWVGALAASQLAPYLQANFILTAEGTEWGDRSVKGMADMLDRQAKYKADQAPDIYFTFGYYQARAVWQVLEKAVELGDLSRTGILEAMEEVGTLTFDGLSGDYTYGSAEERDPPRTSTLYKVNPAKPGGLETLAAGVESEAATNLEFEVVP